MVPKASGFSMELGNHKIVHLGRNDQLLNTSKVVPTHKSPSLPPAKTRIFINLTPRLRSSFKAYSPLHMQTHQSLCPAPTA